MRNLVLCLTVAAASFAADLNRLNGSPIRVNVPNLRSNKGLVRCALFDSEDAFPGKPNQAVAGASVPVSNSAAVCEFPHVSPGTYAIAVFHDENSNGKLDTNFIGIPKEGVGASTNPKPRMGPPRFKESKFQHTTEPTVLEVKLIY